MLIIPKYNLTSTGFAKELNETVARTAVLPFCKCAPSPRAGLWLPTRNGKDNAMNYWSLCLAALMLTGALIGQTTGPRSDDALAPSLAHATMSGLPVLTLRSPATP